MFSHPNNKAKLPTVPLATPSALQTKYRSDLSDHCVLSLQPVTTYKRQVTAGNRKSNEPFDLWSNIARPTEKINEKEEVVVEWL